MVPLVSVLMPTFNRAALIGETLASLAGQRHSNLEVIVVDDGGRDNTHEVVAEFPGVRYHWQPNRKMSAARNVAYSLCQGDYIQFLDSDDLLEPEKIRHHVSYLDDHPEVDIVYGDARYFTTEHPELRAFHLVDHYGTDATRPWIKNAWEDPAPIVEKFLRLNLMPICCPLVRRSALERIGPWDEAIHAHEDWEFWLRAALRGLRFQFAEYPDALALIRTHRTSISWNEVLMSTLTFRLHLARRLKPPHLIENYWLACGAANQLSKPKQLRSRFAYLLAARCHPALVRSMVGAALHSSHSG